MNTSPDNGTLYGTHFSDRIVVGSGEGDVNGVMVQTGVTTGTAPIISAVGDDSNISLTLKAKGSGTVGVSGVTAGTVTASQPVIVDANGAVAGLKVAVGGAATTTTGGLVGSLEDITSTTSGTVQSTEYVLNSVSIPASAFNANTRGIRISAWGTLAANANAKNLKLYVGATALGTITGSTASGKDYFVSASVLRTGSATQSGGGTITIDTAVQAVASATLAESDTAAIVISIKSANTAAAAASATGKGMFVLFGN